jgi:hypothetical protein
MPKSQNKAGKGGRPGKNSGRNTNKKYSASRRWITNSAKRVFQHLKRHGPLNHRRKGWVKPKIEDVEIFVMGKEIPVPNTLAQTQRDGTAKMNVPEETWTQVKRLASRWLSEVA